MEMPKNIKVSDAIVKVPLDKLNPSIEIKCLNRDFNPT